MDVLEKSYPKQELVSIMKDLQYNKNPLELVGTGGLKSQYYPADFDFLSKIKNKLNVDKSFVEFQRILKDINNEDNLYFIELKLQDRYGNKHKFFKIDEFKKDIFNKFFNDTLELIKIDCIIMLNGIFKELSVIYFFNPKPLDLKEYVKVLLKDQENYIEEKKYYKSLKRLMLASKYEEVPDNNLIIAITKLFNSSVGALYQLKNEIDACVIFMDKYNDNLSNKKVNLFIKNIGFENLNKNQLEELSKEYGNLIDREALKFYRHYKMRVGEFPEYNKVKPVYKPTKTVYKYA